MDTSPDTDAAQRKGCSPLAAAHGMAASAGRPYYGAALQRSCIMARLMSGPATRAELERTCRAPCVTKRISELRRQGFEIAGGWAPMAGPDGTVTATRVYSLAPRDDSQGSLFGNEAAA